MASDRTERRLAAIMFTDIVGYTALMAESEAKGGTRSFGLRSTRPIGIVVPPIGVT